MTNRERFKELRGTNTLICEHNPDDRRDDRAHTSDEWHADAVIEIDKKGGWRLCADCFSLPRFQKLPQDVITL